MGGGLDTAVVILGALVTAQSVSVVSSRGTGATIRHGCARFLEGTGSRCPADYPTVVFWFVAGWLRACRSRSGYSKRTGCWELGPSDDEGDNS